MQCVAGCGLRLFEVRFQVRFAVLIPFKCGLERGLRFLDVSDEKFSFCSKIQNILLRRVDEPTYQY